MFRKVPVVYTRIDMGKLTLFLREEEAEEEAVEVFAVAVVEDSSPDSNSRSE